MESKADVLKAYPEIPPNANLRELLWDDPLFNPRDPSEQAVWGTQDEVIDPEFIELRRDTRLFAIELLYRQVKELQESVGRWAWSNRQLMDRGQCTSEMLEQIKIDGSTIKTIEPGFSFWSWYQTDCAAVEARIQSWCKT